MTQQWSNMSRDARRRFRLAYNAAPEQWRAKHVIVVHRPELERPGYTVCTMQDQMLIWDEITGDVVIAALHEATCRQSREWVRQILRYQWEKGQRVLHVSTVFRTPWKQQRGRDVLCGR